MTTSPSVIIDRIHLAMLNVGIVCTLLFAMDGLIHRFFIPGDKPSSLNGWYIYFDGDITTVVFGTWKEPGVTHKFCSKAESSLSFEENKAYRMRLEQARKKLAEEIARIQAKCRKNAAYIWRKATTTGIDQNEYALRKRFFPFNAKTSDRGNLIVPMYNIDGEIQSLQFIHPDGIKKFMKGSQKKGNFCLVDEAGIKLQDATVVVICEGYATGCSIHQATGHLVVVAFDVGNLLSVAEVVRNKYPDLKIIIAADDDIETTGNPGIRMATEAARAVGGFLASPAFKDHKGKSDFNCMYVEQGSEPVLNQIEAAAVPIATDSANSGTEAEGAQAEGEVGDDPCHVAPTDTEINAKSTTEKTEKSREDYTASSFPDIPFPIDVLPQYMQLLIDKYCKALQCPTAFMAMNFLTVISGAAGNSVLLAIKRSWKTAPFLWFGVVDKSGAGKTHPQEAAMSPLRDLQAVEQSRYDKDLEEYKSDKAAYDRCKPDCEPPPEPVPVMHYYTQSFTMESLVPIYRRSTRGIVIYVDELAGLLKSLGQYKGGKGSDNEQFLQLYGCKALKADRATKNGFCRESGAAIMGGIQPGIFASVFGEKEEQNGMLYRFLPMLMNSTPPKYSDDDISQSDEKEWSAIIDWMYSIPAEVDPETGYINRNILTLNAEGKTVFTEFHHELRILKPFMSKRFGGYLPKLMDYFIKFITILHLLECYEYDALTLTINKDTVEGAMKLTRYFAGQARQLSSGAAGNSNPYHDILHKAIESLQCEVEGGKLLLSRIREKMNEMLPPDLQLETTQNKMLATWLKDVGLTVTKRSDNKSVVLIA